MKREVLPSRRQFLQSGQVAVAASLLANFSSGETMKLREAKAAAPAIKATLKTPKGKVELG